MDSNPPRHTFLFACRKSTARGSVRGVSAASWHTSADGGRRTAAFAAAHVGGMIRSARHACSTPMHGALCTHVAVQRHCQQSTSYTGARGRRTCWPGKLRSTWGFVRVRWEGRHNRHCLQRGARAGSGTCPFRHASLEAVESVFGRCVVHARTHQGQLHESHQPAPALACVASVGLAALCCSADSEGACIT